MESKRFLEEIESAFEKRDCDTVRFLVRHLEAAHRRYHALLNQANDAILILCPETGTILETNSQARAIFQFSQDELQHLSVTDLHPPQDRQAIWEEYQRTLAEGNHFSSALPAVRRDGTPIFVDVSSARIDLGSEIVIQSIFRDVSERVHMLRETEEKNRILEEKNAQLEEAQQIRSEFLATITHELRTPLNAIIGFNSLLEEGVYGPLTEKQAKAAQRIDRNATRLLALINQLLDLSRIEAGAVAVFNEKTDLLRLARQVFDDYRSMAVEKNLSLEMSHPNRGVVCLTDGDKLREIIRQLVSNAVKFTSQGFIRVVIREEEANGIVEISDTGPGIAAERREAIFELFRQGDSSYTRRNEGAGLGLAIVRRLAALLGIRVELTSDPGKGSTFRLVIPSAVLMEKPAERTIEPEKVTQQEPPVAGEEDAKLVLVVDDDPYTVEILSEFLETRGRYRVLKAYSGMHAMLYLAQNRPDYLLVDLLMPQINGDRVIQYCRELWGKDGVRIIVITGKILGDGDLRELKTKVEAVIRKGDLRPQTLAHALESAIPLYHTARA